MRKVAVTCRLIAIKGVDVKTQLGSPSVLSKRVSRKYTNTRVQYELYAAIYFLLFLTSALEHLIFFKIRNKFECRNLSARKQIPNEEIQFDVNARRTIGWTTRRGSIEKYAVRSRVKNSHTYVNYSAITVNYSK